MELLKPWEPGMVGDTSAQHSLVEIAIIVGIRANQCMFQYTGPHDKNNKEIYEGDILRKSTFVDNDFTETYLDIVTIGVVRILPSCGTTICDCIVYETDDSYKEKKMKERIKRVHVVGKRCEIIGNIYDDPELLKTE